LYQAQALPTTTSVLVVNILSQDSMNLELGRYLGIWDFRRPMPFPSMERPQALLGFDRTVDVTPTVTREYAKQGQ
jgi:hypothetical protein